MPETDTRRGAALREAQAEVHRNREELIRAGLALRTQFHELADWHTWYRRSPMIWLGGAFVLGFLAGRPSFSRRRR